MLRKSNGLGTANKPNEGPTRRAGIVVLVAACGLAALASACAGSADNGDPGAGTAGDGAAGASATAAGSAGVGAGGVSGGNAGIGGSSGIGGNAGIGAVAGIGGTTGSGGTAGGNNTGGGVAAAGSAGAMNGGSSGRGGSGNSGGNTAGGGGSSAVVCTSKATWNGGNGINMRPGNTCPSCHNFTIAGTIYPTAHEPTNCNGVNGATGLKVLIKGANGTTLTLTPSSAGNFYSNSNVAKPFTVTLVGNGGAMRSMLSPQTSGDCNSCHTQNGSNAAPGRIMSP